MRRPSLILLFGLLVCFIIIFSLHRNLRTPNARLTTPVKAAAAEPKSTPAVTSTLPPIPIPTLTYTIPASPNWTQFAYTQYVTQAERLCHSIMIFAALEKLGSKPDRVLLYPKDWDRGADTVKLVTRLLKKAREEYNVKLVPVPRLITRTIDRTWDASFSKLLIFNLTQYERVLNLDSDATLLQDMDELFFFPPAPIAMPPAYWLGSSVFTSMLLLVQPSAEEFKRIERLVNHGFLNEPKRISGDMDLLNKLYKNTTLPLPYRPYTILTSEFLEHDHSLYMGTEDWNPGKIKNETKYVHFSDYPYPKPWNRRPYALPKCKTDDECQSQQIWIRLYSDFRKAMKSICDVRA